MKRVLVHGHCAVFVQDDNNVFPGRVRLLEGGVRYTAAAAANIEGVAGGGRRLEFLEN